jgi:hypothetical protein
VKLVHAEEIKGKVSEPRVLVSRCSSAVHVCDRISLAMSVAVTASFN